MTRLDQIIKSKSDRILLYGAPGTGKTRLGVDLAKRLQRPLFSITLNSDMSPSALLGFWGIRQGETVFIAGPATRALEEGGILLIDEISDCPGSCETVLMSLLNDAAICAVPIPDGRTLTPKPGYKVVATMNSSPAELRQALLDRFEYLLQVDQPCDEQLDTLPSQGMRDYLKTWYSHQTSETFSRPISFRAIQAFAKLATNLEDRQLAADITFGANAQDILNAIELAEAK